ncbi:uncharacterized protein LOC143452544 [Clavelina lepadiformis]|uniref:uncharacterized protein LOC143452544 n=1 Tax=Clavelina lepadiformis TaxID=159417 RepID=UPI0040414588
MWQDFCADLKLQYPSIIYAFLKKNESLWGEHWSCDWFGDLTDDEVSTITESEGLNFSFRYEDCRLLRINDSVFTYESPLTSLAYTIQPTYTLIVIGDADSFRQCRSTVNYLISYLEDHRL